MLNHVVKSLLSTIPTFLLASVLVFSLMHLMPGDPAGVMLGDTATPEQVQALRSAMGFDRPIYVQFYRWFAGMLQGDFGNSRLLQAGPASDLGSGRSQPVHRLLVHGSDPRHRHPHRG